jgi:hypothetical protein
MCNCILIMCFYWMFFMQLLAYMPSLGGSSYNRKKKGYTTAKREVYHIVLAQLMRSISETQGRGGFYATRVLNTFFNTFFCIFFISCFILSGWS